MYGCLINTITLLSAVQGKKLSYNQQAQDGNLKQNLFHKLPKDEDENGHKQMIFIFGEAKLESIFFHRHISIRFSYILWNCFLLHHAVPCNHS